MNTNTSLAIFAVLAAMALMGATAAYIIIPADAVREPTNPPKDNPFGVCKKGGWNDNACQH
jgi:hypothetical protein